MRAKAAERWATHLIPLATRRVGEIIEDATYPSASLSACKLALESEFGSAGKSIDLNVSGTFDVVALLRSRFNRQAPRSGPGEAEP